MVVYLKLAKILLIVNNDVKNKKEANGVNYDVVKNELSLSNLSSVEKMRTSLKS